MTAGQRNCYTQIALLVAQYSIDDVLFSVAEIVRNIEYAEKPETARQRIAHEVWLQIERQRDWLAVIK